MLDSAALASRAETLQQQHGFRFPLPQLLARRATPPKLTDADLLTDDFAPVNLYGAGGRGKKKR